MDGEKRLAERIRHNGETQVHLLSIPLPRHHGDRGPGRALPALQQIPQGGGATGEAFGIQPAIQPHAPQLRTGVAQQRLHSRVGIEHRTKRSASSTGRGFSCTSVRNLASVERSISSLLRVSVTSCSMASNPPPGRETGRISMSLTTPSALTRAMASVSCLRQMPSRHCRSTCSRWASSRQASASHSSMVRPSARGRPSSR